MPGFLPARVANPLTLFFGNRIDFSNFGRTSVNKGIASYTKEQIYDRVYVWGGIIIGGAAGWLLKECLTDSESYAPGVLAVTAGVMAGFYYTHKKVMQPRLDARNKLIDDGELIKAEIKSRLEQLAAILEETDSKVVSLQVIALVKMIDSYSMSDQDHSHATRTLLVKKNGLANILEALNKNLEAKSPEETLVFWRTDKDTLFSQFVSNRIQPTDESENLATSPTLS